LRATLAIAGVLVLAGACSSDTDEEQKRLAELAQGCVLNSDCKNPYACVFRKCHEQCADSRDCPPGQLCVATDDDDGLRVCQLPAETKCKETQDCQGKQICGPDGRCRDHCASATDCGELQVCANQGTCAESEEVDEDNDLIVQDAGVDGGGGSAGSGGAGGSAGSAGGSGGAGGSAGAGGTAGAAGSGGSAPDASVDSGSDAASCAAGFADCDANPADCETPLNSPTSCGSCATKCEAPNAVVVCNANLSCELTACDVGFGDCDGALANGCETDVTSSANHCGKCGRSCGVGTCQSGQCSAAPLGTFTGSSPRGAIGPNHVYVITEASGAYTLQRIAKDGSGAQVVDTVTADAGGFFADASFVYVARSTDGIERYDALTGQADTSWGAVTPAFAAHLTSNASAFYWITTNSAAYTSPKATGVPQLPLSAAPSGGQTSTGVVVTNNAVYISANNGTNSFVVPITGGTAEQLALPSGGGHRFTATGSSAYVSVSSQGIFGHSYDPAKMPQDPPTLVHPQAVTFTGLIADGASLIYTRSAITSVYSVPIAGGNATVLGTVTGLAGILGVDSGFVYLHAGSTVYQLAK
jgi:hypothetical protein